jgi:hypothetical protein
VAIAVIMQWSERDSTLDQGAQPVARIDFDVIRAIVGARQAASATCRANSRAIAAATGDHGMHDKTIIGMFAGKDQNAATAMSNGRFSATDFVTSTPSPLTDDAARSDGGAFKNMGKSHA